MKFLSKLSLILLTMAGAALAGCTTGGFNGASRDGMNMVVVWKNPDIGQLTDQEYATVVRHADFCRNEVAHRQLSGPVEAAATDAVAYGTAGAVGVGVGAEVGGVATLGAMAPYGGAAGGANGVVSGLKQHSGAVAAVTGTCVRDNLNDVPTRMRGVHATTAYVRTRNSSDRVPDWVVPAASVAAQPTGSRIIENDEAEADEEDRPPDAADGPR